MGWTHSCKTDSGSWPRSGEVESTGINGWPHLCTSVKSIKKVALKLQDFCYILFNLSLSLWSFLLIGLILYLWGSRKSLSNSSSGGSKFEDGNRYSLISYSRISSVKWEGKCTIAPINACINKVYDNIIRQTCFRFCVVAINTKEAIKHREKRCSTYKLNAGYMIISSDKGVFASASSQSIQKKQ